MVNINISMQRITVTLLMNSFFFLTQRGCDRPNTPPPLPRFGTLIILLQNFSTVQDAEKDEKLLDCETEVTIGCYLLYTIDKIR